MTYVQEFDISVRPTNRAERKLPDPVYDDFEVKKAKVEQVHGAGGSIATLNVVYPDDIELEEVGKLAKRKHQDEFKITVQQTTRVPPSQTDDLNITIDTSVVSNATIPNVYQTSGTRMGPKTSEEQRLYTGRPIEVRRTEDRVVKIKLMDRRLLMNRSFVALETRPEKESFSSIVVDLLENELGLERSYFSDPRTQTQWTPNGDYIIHEGAQNADREIFANYGLEEPVSLFRVLQDLAVKEGVYFYIDRYNVIHFRTMPRSNILVPQIVTGLESGENSESNDVLVKSPFDQTGTGMFRTISSEPINETINFEPTGRTEVRTIAEKNVDTAPQAEVRAMSEWMQTELSQSTGTLTTLGNPGVYVYDDIYLKHLGDYRPVGRGYYGVKGITHTIDTETGWLTDIELTSSITDLYDQLAAESREAASRSQEIVSGKPEEEGLLGTIWNGAQQQLYFRIDLITDVSDSIGSFLDDETPL